jgi:hypothetical protein
MATLDMWILGKQSGCADDFCHGYKMVKWIERIEFIETEKHLGEGEGGKNEDDEYFDLLPNI